MRPVKTSVRVGVRLVLNDAEICPSGWVVFLYEDMVEIKQLNLLFYVTSLFQVRAEISLFNEIVEKRPST